MKQAKKNIKKRGNKNYKNKRILLAIGLIIILAVLILVLLFYYGKILIDEQNLKKEGSNLDKKAGIGELNTLPPGGDTSASGGEANPSTGKEKTKEQGEILESNQTFVEGKTRSSTTSSEDLAVSANGKLTIVNYVDGIGSTDFVLAHFEGPAETVEVNDFLFYAMYCPDCNQLTKIISKIGSDELEADTRPKNSTSTIYLELSLASRTGDDISVDNKINQLILAMPLESQGYDFGEKTLTIQQYDPSDPRVSYPSYDVREVIANDAGVIELPNLDGTYGSEDPYAYFKIRFS